MPDDTVLPEPNSSHPGDEGTRARIIDVLTRNSVAAAAWRIEPGDLLELLRAMDPKTRNRFLSYHRMPSSKLSTATARLMATNVARRGTRVKAASTVASPVMDAAIAAVDYASNQTDPAAALVAGVTDVVDKFSAGAVRLAAVAVSYEDPIRMIPWFVACWRAGLFEDDTLQASAQELADLADELLLAAGRERDLAAPDPQTADADLVQTWQAAKSSADQAVIDLGEGRPVAVDDLSTFARYNEILSQEAARFGTAEIVSEVFAAEARSAVAESVGDDLARLIGPDAFTADIRAMVDALGQSPDDAELAQRLALFCQLVSEQDAMNRLQLAGELRRLPSPPSAALRVRGDRAAPLLR